MNILPPQFQVDAQAAMLGEILAPLTQAELPTAAAELSPGQPVHLIPLPDHVRVRLQQQREARLDAVRGRGEGSRDERQALLGMRVERDAPRSGMRVEQEPPRSGMRVELEAPRSGMRVELEDPRVGHEQQAADEGYPPASAVTTAFASRAPVESAPAAGGSG